MIPSDWYGTKRLVKRALSTQPLNRVLLSVVGRATPTVSIARLPVAVREVRGVIRGHEFVMVNPTMCSIAKELHWGRGERVRPNERLALELFYDLARASDVVLDIGANTGLFAICAALASPTSVIQAFEIVPEVFEVLFRNVVRNDLAYRIDCRLQAIAKLDLLLRVPSFAKTSSLPTSASIVEQPISGTRVRCVSLDEVTHDAHGRILMKIDVEGGEDVLFENGARTLRDHAPDMICEVLPNTDNRGVIPRTMQSFGYQLYRIEDEVIRRMEALTPSPRFHDWFFTRSDARDLAARTTVPVVS